MGKGGVAPNRGPKCSDVADGLINADRHRKENYRKALPKKVYSSGDGYDDPFSIRFEHAISPKASFEPQDCFGHSIMRGMTNKEPGCVRSLTPCRVNNAF